MKPWGMVALSRCNYAVGSLVVYVGAVLISRCYLLWCFPVAVDVPIYRGCERKVLESTNSQTPHLGRSASLVCQPFTK